MYEAKKNKNGKIAKKKRIKTKNEKQKKGTVWSQEIVASVTSPKKEVKNRKKGPPHRRHYFESPAGVKNKK
jgi:hypothetical protein